MSNINPQSIDGTYPIAGQDNNSQGFRDNFTNTVNNFTFAAAELTDLQNNAVLKAALGSVGQTGTPTNDMNYAYLTHPQIKGAVETKNAIGNVISGTFNVDWSTGHFQTVELVGTAATLNFSSTWPATNLYTRLRLQVNTYANVCALTLPSAVSTNISSIQGASGQVITLPAGSVYQFEFSTWDQGATVAIQDVLRNYDITANGASSTFTTVIAGTVNARTIGNTGAFLTASTVAVGNISAVTIGNTGAVITGTTGAFSGNVIGGLAQFASINSTPIGNATPAAGAFTTLSATGTTTLAGSIATTGLQHFYPTANVAITGNIGVSRILVTPTTDPAPVSFFVDVTLPNVTTDGTVLSISSNVAVNELRTLSPWVGTTVSPSANVSLTAGSQAQYLYRSAESKWYKIA